MAENKRPTVGVFGVVRKHGGDGLIRVLCNVRTDQEKQRTAAGLLGSTEVLIVDLPGGGFSVNDRTFDDALRREVLAETGVELDSKLTDFSAPFYSEPLNDLAFVCQITLVDEPKITQGPFGPSHVWLTWDELEAEDAFRLPGRLGKYGRMAKMIKRELWPDTH